MHGSTFSYLYALTCIVIVLTSTLSLSYSQNKMAGQFPNIEVLQRCNTTGIEAIVMRSSLNCAGAVSLHACQISEFRKLSSTPSFSKVPGPKEDRRNATNYKDNLKDNLRSTGIIIIYDTRHSGTMIYAGIDINCWESTAASRSTWRATCCAGVMSYEDQRITREMQRRQRRKDITSTSTAQSSQHICLHSLWTLVCSKDRSGVPYENSQVVLTRDSSVCQDRRLHHVFSS